jgi:glycosyltransferase involved in cell wall biosynthesis
VSRPLRVLVVHSDLHSRLFECSEVWQYLRALAATTDNGQVAVSATDCRRVYDVTFDTPIGGLVAGTGMLRGLRRPVDVGVVFGPLPWYHLLVALALRLRGVPVVFAPLALLTRDFAQGSWYLGRGRLFRQAKPWLVRALGRLWARAAAVIVCASAHEVRDSGLPPGQVVLLPWPLPDTPLAALAARADMDDLHRDPQGPVALASRYDPWRKGFDRLATWLETHGDALPRPALVLLTPEPEQDDPVAVRLRRLAADGLVDWDTTTRGQSLADRLRTCRGAVLLSRWDGQPRALREAALMGLPILCNASANFAEVLDALGAGAVVDGDDPDAVQAGYLQLCGPQDAAVRARALFDPDAVGRFLGEVLAAVAGGRPPPHRSYYDAFDSGA